MVFPKQTDGSEREKYDELLSSAKRLKVRLIEQIETILEENSISLGVPIESRIKTYASIKEKIKRKTDKNISIDQIEDIVGIRIIVLFQRDYEKLHDLISSNFSIIDFDDKSKILQDNQFGYQSNHYVIRVPDSWLKIPSFKGLDKLSAEIQVRTVAQHIWAAASHKLQYKREDSVPKKLRRSIHRISALLETVDLELSRLIDQRIEYVDSLSSIDLVNKELNVDILKQILQNTWPIENHHPSENYENLLVELNKLEVHNGKMFIEILNRHKNDTLNFEKNYPKEFNRYSPDELDRFERGVYFTHLGLTRHALGIEFGEDYINRILIHNDEFEDDAEDRDEDNFL